MGQGWRGHVTWRCVPFCMVVLRQVAARDSSTGGAHVTLILLAFSSKLVVSTRAKPAAASCTARRLLHLSETIAPSVSRLMKLTSYCSGGTLSWLRSPRRTRARSAGRKRRPNGAAMESGREVTAHRPSIHGGKLRLSVRPSPEPPGKICCCLGWSASSRVSSSRRAGSVVAARFVTNDWGEVAARRRPGNAAQAAAASRTSPRVGHREAVSMVGAVLALDKRVAGFT